MKRVFEGEVYDIIPQPNGIVFSYCKEKSDEHILVSYKMYSLENNKTTDVAKNIYLLSKFGSNYRSVTEGFLNHVTVRSVIFPNGKVFTLERDGKATLFGTEGESVWQGVMKYRGNPPTDISFHKNSLWCAYGEANALIRYNLLNMREEIRVGGGISPFSKPSDIFVRDNSAVISNPASNKLVKLDFDNFEVTDYKEFTEPVYAYAGVKDTEFLVMESGIYIM
ncbi:MAG: hypothetical protein E7561_04300 [Ruminococcaceae bacterium]|nr:hypothetical protein [Oscillospiraceae bacterium]